MTAIAQVCDPDVFGDIDPDNITTCESCVQVLRQLRGDVTDMIVKCGFIDEHDNCTELFREVITEEGICYTFNGINIYRDNSSEHNGESENWNIEEGYRANLTFKEKIPKPGSKFSLATFMTLTSSKYDYLCKGPVQGFKIYLHLPIEEPLVSKHYYLVPMQQALELTVSPNIVITSDELRDFSVEKRQCYFSDERYLRFYKYYTQNNCESECLTNFTVKECGCLRFNMPSKFAQIDFGRYNLTFVNRDSWNRNLWYS
jgi:acid-sensing ion channel, other